MVNKVILIGRIANDLNLRVSNKGINAMNFNLSINSNKPNEQTIFVPCFAFGQTAETMHKMLKKGFLIYVEGKISVFLFKNNDNKSQKSVDILINKFSIISKPKSFLSSTNDSKNINYQKEQDDATTESLSEPLYRADDNDNSLGIENLKPLDDEFNDKENNDLF